MGRTNPLKQLADAGQSFWMDTISRDMIRDGTLKRIIRDDGLRGVTSNPDIFQKAISGSKLYDEQIARLARKGLNAAEVYEALAVDDMQKAADVLKPVHEATDGVDGYISLEVSPYLAFDTEGTVTEAVRLWESVNRSNVFIKIPATPPGIDAIRQVIARGIPVNVTLIFSLSCYEQVMDAYIRGLTEYFAARGTAPGPASVASFFVSRIDLLVDKLLANRIAAGANAQALMGKAAVAAAKVAYQMYLERFEAQPFAELRRKGARVQRPLWASTSTKNPLYDPTMYVAPLVGRDTVNTMPMVTIDAWRQNGTVKADTILDGVDEAWETLAALERLGISLECATWQLQEEGVSKFNAPFDKLLTSLSEKRCATLGCTASQTETLGDAEKTVGPVMEAATDARLGVRLAARDVTIWPGGPEVWQKIANRLGWLSVAQEMLGKAKDLEKFAASVAADKIRHVVLLGMGGSSLCPEVCARVFGARSKYPELIVLDSTVPEAIAAVRDRINAKSTLFLAASKSGTTIETSTLTKYFVDVLRDGGVQNPGRHFIAITDPGTVLEKAGRMEGYRRVFINPPDIGGRYSALSYFGLVPMALLGMKVETLLQQVIDAGRDFAIVPQVSADAPVRLGVTLGAMALAGRNKLTLIMPERLVSFGSWVEQLVAESTGKEGKGILPVVGEGPESVAVDAQHRVYVIYESKGEAVPKRLLSAVEKSGAPLVRIQLPSVDGLIYEFLRWEIATAAAGFVLGINPFDEPNVAESKANTSAVLQHQGETGRLPWPKPDGTVASFPAAFTRAAAKQMGAALKGKNALKGLLSTAQPGDYAALLAFAHADEKTTRALELLRAALAKTAGCPATLGIGPRYLHSTGQLHKGGDASGIFIVLVHDSELPLDIPGEEFPFSVLAAAQGIGDYQSLEDHGRRAAFVRISGDPARAVAQIVKSLGKV